MRLTKAQKAAITALEDIKARDITTLDTRKLTAMYDALIIATADSARQTKALARNVHDKVKAAGGSVLSTEGEDTGEWVLVDCADFVVHIMQPTARALYNLEELWTPPAPRKRTGAAKAIPASDTAASAEAATTQSTVGRQPARTGRASAGSTADPSAAAKGAKPTATTRRRSSSAKAPATKAAATARTTPKAATAPARRRTPAAEAAAAAPAAPTPPKAKPRSTPAAPRARRRVVE